MTKTESRRGWRQQVDAGVKRDDLVIPINMPWRCWEAVFEALGTANRNTADLTDAYCRIEAMRKRVIEATKKESPIERRIGELSSEYLARTKQNKPHDLRNAFGYVGPKDSYPWVDHELD